MPSRNFAGAGAPISSLTSTAFERIASPHAEKRMKLLLGTLASIAFLFLVGFAYVAIRDQPSALSASEVARVEKEKEASDALRSRIVARSSDKCEPQVAELIKLND